MNKNQPSQLAKQAVEADGVLKRISGKVGTVKFDAFDDASIAAAIRQMEKTIDYEVGHHHANPFVAPIVVRLKESYREGILSTARQVRASKAN